MVKFFFKTLLFMALYAVITAVPGHIKLKSENIILGAPQVIPCVPDNYKIKCYTFDVFRYYWFGPYGVIETDDEKIRVNKATGDLMIDKFDISDAGAYKCIIEYSRNWEIKAHKPISITHFLEACVQPSENHQCPEGFTLRNNLCYPSQTETEEETYVPSPRKTPSMLEYPIPLVTAAVGVPLLFISLSVIIWKCNSCGCEAVKSANTEDHTNKDDRTKIKYSLVPQKDEDQTVIRNEKRKCKSVKEKRAKNVQNFHLPERERKANVLLTGRTSKIVMSQMK
ncbi:uncharacterized protein LOC143231773 isoform X1 [Tachypleus tridentatus]|uniref:uncharacterized protein LOC143231773 isoform X1 n=1 Tax=Tachypleus tridentatus TaxID=6853 RepID=UPI003FD1549C